MRYCSLVLSLGMLVVTISNVQAKDDNPAYLTAKDAGPDFATQGEYLGTVGADDDARWGCQVIALGDGNFRAVGLRGGLPGDGWERGNDRNELNGKREGDAVVFDGGEFVLRIQDGVLTVESPDGDKWGELKKVNRKSPTLGAKPPVRAVVLFDGSGVDHWNGGKLTEGNLLAATNVESKEKLGDHKLHIEFRTPFMPHSLGQARGNSGVYVQGRYEVQVLDSFGLEGKDNECGGIYSVSEPAVNMCYPPLSWQTYDIDFQAARYKDGQKVKNARITVRHNGTVIHDDIELPKDTPGRHAEGDGPESLFLQDHSNPVVFRNVWVVKQ